jgi:hypothetical protein
MAERPIERGATQVLASIQQANARRTIIVGARPASAA